jgi:hypothetical protein
MASKWTRPQRIAVAAASAVVISSTVATLTFFRGTPHSVQQSGASNTQGDVTASTGGVAVGHGGTINVVNPIASDAKIKASEPSLYFECHIGWMPTKPKESRVYVLELQPMQAPYGGGLAEFFSLAVQPEFKWPTTSNGMPLQAQRCEITNYWNDTIFNVETALQLEFEEAIADKDQPNASHSGSVTLSRVWNIEVAKIDPGGAHSFSFYILNVSQQFAQVALPDTATGQVLGQNQRRPISVIHPVMYPMTFVPFVAAKG